MMREEFWEEKFGEAMKALGAGVGQVAGRKSGLVKVQFAALMKATTSVSNGWLARRLEMG